MRYLFGAVLAISFAVVSAAPPRPVSGMDRDFVRNASMGGAMEVQLGQYAADHGHSAAVRRFGARMVHDHQAAGRELMQIARRQGVNAPMKPSADMQDSMRKLTRLSGRAFDLAYKQAMINGHQGVLMQFQDEAKNGKGPFRDFARRTVPTIRIHLQMAQSMRVGR